MNFDPSGSSPARDATHAAVGNQVHTAASLQAASRREFLTACLSAAGVVIATPLLAARAHAGVRRDSRDEELSGASAPVAAAVSMKVYKDPGCGCCKEWIKHIQKAGFTVTSEDSTTMDAIKTRLGVPAALASCHTAIVGDYLVEGHVPADVLQKLLKEKPSARGLAVPGMPMGSPGMEGPTKDKYNVMLFDRLGKATVYASR